MRNSAATETLTSAKLDAKDQSTATKDLERGTKSVDDAKIRCQDPRTSLEALAKGITSER